MPSIINTLEVVTEPEATPSPQPPTASPAAAAAAPDPQKAAKEIAQILRVAAERRLRLRAH